ncbi:hypothetical protein CYY_006079 [Polysphondylium violaceum]|uniref:V-type proton ATPase subunit S1/VOA1 transmembrane domain-containing protein n=1 Tax=Polysphondylium violaceum TaxID=133409 RepID=A0A8J4URR1_9MYCE|nr:hypothetical protein CYY_006079 [Polysphondylium violaceum]
MKFITLFILVNIILGAAIASLNVPILGWSSKEKFFSKSQINEYNQHQFKSLLSHIIKDGSFETLTIFVEPKLRSDQLSAIFDSYSSKSNGGNLNTLKTSFESAASNVYIPYTQTSGSFVSSVISQIKDEINGQLIVAKDFNSQFDIEGATIVSLDSVSDISNIMKNKVLDVLIVVLPNEIESQDQIISKFETLSGSNFVSFFTSESASEVDIKMNFQHNVISRQEFVSHLVNADSASKHSSEAPPAPTPAPSSSSSSGSEEGQHKYFNYFTGPIMETYLIIGILLAIFFTGLCCLLDLQVPDRYEAPKQKVL